MKAALLVDGNFITYRTVSVVQPNEDTKIRVDSKEDMAMFIRKIAIDFCSQVRLFDGLFDTVVWTIDKKSWRKTYFPEAEYKANRVIDETINWENVSTVRDEFLDIMKRNGVLVSVVEGAEGDDLIYEWSKYYRSKRKPSIILSGDKDLNQLVHFDENSYCVQYSPITSKLYCAPGFEQWLKSAADDEKKVDIFNVTRPSKSADKMLLNDIVRQKQLTTVEVPVLDFIFKKVLIGDAGDNVKPAFNYTKPNKSGKVINHGISEGKAEKIVEEYKQSDELNVEDLYGNEQTKKLADITYKTMKAEGIMAASQIAQNIKMNATLVALNDLSIPDKVVDAIKADIIDNDGNRHNLNFQNLTIMQNLLKNTEYISDNYVQVKANVFKGEKIDENDTSFIKKKQTKLF